MFAKFYPLKENIYGKKLCELSLNLNSLSLHSNFKKLYPVPHFDFIFDFLDEKFAPAGQMF